MQELGGNQVVLSAAPTSAYADGAGLGFTTDGSTSDDITFGAVDGHAIITHGTVHKKYDGTTVRNWGIETPLEPPELDSMALVSKTIATCAQADAEFSAATEGTRGYATGYDGVANSATTLTPAAGTGRGEMTYTFASTQNLLNFSGAEGGDFDQFEFYFNNADPTKFQFLQINFGLTAGSDPFASDGFFYTFGSELPPIGLTKEEIIQSAHTSVAKAVDPEPQRPEIGDSGDPIRWGPDKSTGENTAGEVRENRKTI